MFIVVAVVSAVAALAPLLRGRPVNVTFLVVAGFWLIVAIVVVNRSSASSGADRH